MRTPKNEPVAIAGVVAGLVGALMVMATSLGWIELSAEQQTNILAFVVLVAPILANAFARSQVTTTRDPQIITEHGEKVDLVRADTGLPPSVHP